MSVFLSELLESELLFQSLRSLDNKFLQFADRILTSISQRKTILTAGNGGSASQASHFAAELVGRFEIERRAIAAVSLSADMSTLTSIANDYTYSDVFTRQISAFIPSAIHCCFFTTSGNSDNILSAAHYCHSNDIEFSILSGATGGAAAKYYPDQTLLIPSSSTPRIQEAHLVVLHALCKYIETSLLPTG